MILKYFLSLHLVTSSQDYYILLTINNNKFTKKITTATGKLLLILSADSYKQSKDSSTDPNHLNWAMLIRCARLLTSPEPIAVDPF